MHCVDCAPAWRVVMSELDDPRLSTLYRQAPASEPDPRSDALIVDAAHRAVRKKTRHGA